MITRSIRIKAAGLAISLMSLSVSPFCLAVSAEGEKNSRASKLTGAEIMVQRIAKGIVVDVSPLEGGSPIKVLHDPAQYDAVKAAGFQSVRIYVVAMKGPAVYKTRIDDALDRGLAVVISLWGNGQWISNPKEGMQDFVESWDKFAKFYKDYPENLVFDLWNEPAGLLVQNGKFLGIKDGGMVMEYLNEVIPVIRKSNPNRVLGIAGPGLNG